MKTLAAIGFAVLLFLLYPTAVTLFLGSLAVAAAALEETKHS